ncbi:MAG: prepilin-type N-terminal cleavage/methylation domain-containing protein [bacterium]
MKGRKGLTLIELIAVFAIVALLVAVVVPITFGQVRKGRVSRIISEAETLRAASLKYFSDHNAWPQDTVTDGAILVLIQQSPNPLSPSWRGPYLDRTPRRRAGDNRFSNAYGGLLMLNDVDDGFGDDATADYNSNGITPDRFCYEGQVPLLDASLLDQSVDGVIDLNTGAIVWYSGGDWSASSEGTADLLFIIAEAF